MIWRWCPNGTRCDLLPDDSAEAVPLGEVGLSDDVWYSAVAGELVFDGAWHVPTFATAQEGAEHLAIVMGCALPSFDGP